MEYEYSPYTCQRGREIPAFEIFDQRGITILMTNENMPGIEQENIARLAAKAPELAAAGEKVIRCWENGDLADAVRELAAVLDYPTEAIDS